jgi:hypothetical protein
MFCPECRSEYQRGFTRCEDCDVALVLALPRGSMQATAEPQFETVFVTISPSEANLIQSLLVGSGIEAAVFDENLSRMDPPAMLLIGGMKIAVPKEQRDAALEVLKGYREGPVLVSVDANDGDEYRCPRCSALLEAETTVCPSCGTNLFEDGAPYPGAPRSRF